MTGRLEGKVAVITGASSGIGQATAPLFAREGAKVLLVDIDEEGGQRTLNTIREAGGEASFFRADVSKTLEVQAMVLEAVRLYGRLDCAFNNAGIDGPVLPITAYPEEEWDRVIAVNLKGVWLCMKYEVEQMLKQGGGVIVNTSSQLGLVGVEQPLSGYAASKHGVVGLTRQVAMECARQNIRVNAVCPGTVATPMLNQLMASNPEIAAFARASTPTGRIAEPDQIGQAALWLCSEESSYVNGQAIAIDAGATAR